MADYDADVRDYDDDRREYDRDRSRSPRNNDNGVRARSASPNGRDRYDNGDGPNSDKADDPNVNPGSNLFVTGIAPRLSEEEITRLFSEFGEVSSCNIMRDPHSGESRGFGFVKMATGEAADAARDGLSGKLHEGRTLSIEKARRGRPRTPTPGKYYGPPKRDFRASGRGGGGRRFEPYDDRRRGYGGGGRRDDYYSRGAGGYGGRDDYYSRGSGGGYGGRDRYDDRSGGGDYGYSGGRSYGGGRDREDYPPRDRNDRYGGGSREDRRGGAAGGYYSRDDRGGGPRSGGFEDRAPGGYTDPPPREPYPAGGARGYEDRGEDRYSRR